MYRYRIWIIFLVTCAGCSGGITFDTPISLSPANWTQYGGSRQHLPLNASSLKPPFRLRWQQSVGGSFGPASPIAGEQLIFTPSLNGWIYLFDKQLGKEVGHISLRGSIIGTPAAKDTLLFVPLSSSVTSLIAINMKDAKIRWTKDTGPIESAILIDGDFLYSATLSGNIFCTGLEDSATVWTNALPKQIHSSPVSDGERIILGCDDGAVYAFDKAKGEQTWKFKTNEAVMAAPIIHDGIVFVGSLDKTFYALRSQTGEMLWKRFVDAPVYAPATADEHSLYIGTSGGKLLSIDQKSGNVNWSFQNRSVIDTAPVITDHFIICCGLDKMIRVLDRATGAQVWEFETEGKIRTSPIMLNDVFIVLSENGEIYTFESNIQ